VLYRWYHRLGGCWWNTWQAWTSYFRDVCELELAGDIWDRDRAYADAQSAGWWWPHRQFVIVADRPTEIHREQVGARGWGSHRLHAEGGPAIEFRDGWALWFWHGFQVPQWAVEAPTVEAIAAEPNVETRRCAIESMGWDRFVAESQLQLVDSAPDPGNPGQCIDLYDVPERLWGDRVRMALVTNGSVERDGTRRKYGLTVPAEIDDPVAAIAWTYDVPRDVYAGVARRT
jgi:hypothetical protein